MNISLSMLIIIVLVVLLAILAGPLVWALIGVGLVLLLIFGQGWLKQAAQDIANWIKGQK